MLRSGADTGRWYACAHCHAHIAPADAAIAINGSAEHQCTNPQGVAFRVLCLADAPGATQVGVATLADTFFPPWAWAFALCRTCSAHLGWHYSAIGNVSFWGLIRDHLVIQQTGDAQ